MNFILREETEQGMHNHVIGDEYTLVKRENVDAFRYGINSYLSKHGHSIEDSPVNLDLIYAFITTNCGKVIPLFAEKNLNYYIMTHDGQTFEVIRIPDNLK